MKNLQCSIDLPQLLFSLIFILIMIIACLWVIQPFILSFTWASIVVIATWPIIMRLQNILWGKRILAIVTMTILILLLFIIPVALLVSSLIDNTGPALVWLNQGHLVFPQLNWLNDIPILGKKLYFSYKKLINGGGAPIVQQLQPYIGRTTGFFVAQAGHFGRFMVHLILMLLFSVLLYWRGENVGYIIRHFAFRIGGRCADATVLLAGQAIRAIALGVVVTALIEGILSGVGLAISGIPYVPLLTMLIILTCLIQLGPLVVLIPIVIWLYWTGSTTWGTVLLIWSCIVGTLDNILRPMLIKIGADLPSMLILSGVIGGLIAFGMIGLFIGPVVLALSYRLISVWIHEVPIPENNIETVIKELIKHHE
ncbi:AI-2E family transporter YdiK [Pantoea sp. Mhis]|uniref:AI-2E family transporter YdiK n=1 Tax=Pantoea sp. Mhis TaxID=2576759 RepID=UPI001357C875|nr:AI-2E family transporter YdiK [Pantoea sp. Mhis]MXP56335.1 AI-2E family transporter YdiK [Pantoea sp. Mhis]